MTEELKEITLTGKQKLFADYYVGAARQNATKAAKLAGYSEATAYSIGPRLLKNVEICNYVEARLKELTLSANTVLSRLTDIANGTVSDFINEDGKFDLEMAKTNGKDHLLKKLKRKATSKVVSEDGEEIETSLLFEEFEFEVYSSHEALRDLGKYHKLFTDRTELSGNDGKDLLPQKFILERVNKKEQIDTEDSI